MKKLLLLLLLIVSFVGHSQITETQQLDWIVLPPLSGDSDDDFLVVDQSSQSTERITLTALASRILSINGIALTPDQIEQTEDLIAAMIVDGTHTNLSVTYTDNGSSNGTLNFTAQGGSGDVSSVNSQTGVVVIDADDIDDTSTVNKFVTTAQLSDLALNTSHRSITSGNPHNVTASDVGLGNVDNTSDLDKPISTAVQAELTNLDNSKLNISDVLDQDNMDDNSPIYPVSQQSLIAYVQAQIAGVTLADDSVTPAKMADGNFGAFIVSNNVASLGLGVVSGINIVDATITQALIANGAVNSDRIADSSILEVDLNVDNTGSDGQVLAKSGTGFSWVTNPGITQNATEVPMTGYVEGTNATAPDSNDNVAEAIAKLKNITDGISSSSHPATANQKLVTYHNSKVTVHDSMFTAANLYLGRDYIFNSTDTLELGNDVTANNYNKWLNFIALNLDGNGADSVTVRPIDGNRIFLNGNDSLSAANSNFIVGKNEYGAARKLNDSVWILSVEDLYGGVPVAEAAVPDDPVLALNPLFVYDNTSIVSAGTTNGDAVTGWNDITGNGNHAVASENLSYRNGSQGPEVEFNNSGFFSVNDDLVGEFTLGVDEFTLITRESDNISNVGYYISKAVSTTNDRLFGIHKSSVANYRLLHGGTSTSYNTSLTTVTNKVIIAVFTTTQVEFFIDGVSQGTATLDTTAGDNSNQPINIGARTSGGYTMDTGGLDYVAVLPVAANGTQVQEITDSLRVNAP